MSKPDYDFIIMGAGVAGLYTALKLHAKYPDKSIAIYEKHTAPGGRISTWRDEGYQWECGAGRIALNHFLTMKLLQKYNLTTIPIGNNKEYIGPLHPPAELPKTRRTGGARRGTLYRGGARRGTRKSDNSFHKIFDPLRDVFEHEMARVVKLAKTYTTTELRATTLYKIAGRRGDILLASFGYNSELTVLNAYDALRQFKELQYPNFYVVKEGLSVLIDNLVQELSQSGITVHTEIGIQDYTTSKGIITVTLTNGETLRTPHLILAMNHTALRKIPRLMTKFPAKIDSVITQPLLRTYAVIPGGKKWLGTIPLTTSNPIRYIIPIDPDRGVYMISYTDGADTEHWWKKGRSPEMLSKMIMREIRNLFGKNVPDPVYFKDHYWKSGASYWTTGVNSDRIARKMLEIEPGVHIVGESYSHKQAWIEGALEQAEALIDIL